MASGLRRTIAALLVCLGALPPAVMAHDIPADVTVQAYVKPHGNVLTVVVRVPLQAMRDVNFPLRGDGFLDVSRVDAYLRDAARLWIAGNIEIQEENVRLDGPRLIDARASLPSDRSFASYGTALQHVTGPRLSPDTEITWNQAVLDARFEYSITSDRSRFSIQPSFARLGARVVTVLRFVPSDGEVRAFEFAGDPGLIRLDPQWHQAALRGVRLGFDHILSGTDHLLFLLCLVIPIRRFKRLVFVITAFTAGHSFTLIAAALNAGPNGLWFPPLIETLIAASIVYLALENIVVSATPARLPPTLRTVPPWSIAFAFGLVHGLGFSFALRESLQFAGTHLLTSLLSFNAGVELGQLAMVAIMVPVLFLLFRFVVPEKIGTIVLSSLIAHTAWHWTGDRWGRLRQFGWPTIDVATIASLVRGLTILVAIAAATWLVVTLVSRGLANRSREYTRVDGLIQDEPAPTSAEAPASSERGYMRVEGPAPSDREYTRVEG
ncbi:MAG: HupE/UreJ family protein [Vicinamibacterales bacterium]